MMWHGSHNNALQRADHHQPLGRGRVNFAHKQVCRARVLKCLRAGADVGRYAAPRLALLYQEPRC
jgi:hypothetical protein